MESPIRNGGDAVSVVGEQRDMLDIAEFVKGLQSSNRETRIEHARGLDLVLEFIEGEEAKVEFLSQLIYEVVGEEDCDVILIILERLKNQVPHMWGSHQFKTIFKSIETICCIEEPLVRNKAVETLEYFVETMKDKDDGLCGDLYTYLYEFIEKLSTDSWFTFRSSTASVCHLCLHQGVDANMRKKVLDIFLTLTQDKTPMVRKSASQQFEKVSRNLTMEEIQERLLPQAVCFSQDNQDSMRILSVSIILDLVDKIDTEKVESVVVPMLKRLFEDVSWRIRCMVASQFPQIVEKFKNTIGENELVLHFVNLMNDSEAEVRAAACSQLVLTCRLFSLSLIVTNIFTPIKGCSEDDCVHIRSTLALDISKFALVIGRQHTIDFLVPIMMKLTKDESSEVRLNILSDIDSLNNVIEPEETFEMIFPSIINLLKDPKWRIRMITARHIPTLAKLFGQDLFDRSLLKVSMDLLEDKAFAVRNNAVENMRKLSEIFDPKWTQTYILPNVLEKSNSTNYLYRITSIAAIDTLIDSNRLDTNTLFTDIMTTSLKLSKDPVPNVRLNSVRIIFKLLDKVYMEDQEENHGKSHLEQIKSLMESTLEILRNDPDDDVRESACKKT